MKTVAIIGAGEIGQALAGILKKKKIPVRQWDKDPSKVPGQKPLAEIVSLTDILFLCVPTRAVRVAVSHVLPYLKPKTAVIALSKGVERETLKTVDEILQEMLPSRQPFGMLGGPMLAEELAQGLPGIGVLGTARKESFIKLEKIFTGTNLFLERSADIRGVAISGVLKIFSRLHLALPTASPGIVMPGDGLFPGRSAK